MYSRNWYFQRSFASDSAVLQVWGPVDQEILEDSYSLNISEWTFPPFFLLPADSADLSWH